MAGDWIKVEMATPDKPEIAAMSDMLGMDADQVFGKLMRVWMWFDQHSTDGNAGSVTGDALMRFIDRLIHSQGFAAAMKTVGWLNDNGLPNFDRHNGESSKKRALTQKRVKEHRASKGNASVTLNALPEKRREEVKNIAPEREAPVDNFRQAPKGANGSENRSEARRLWIEATAQRLGLEARPGEEWDAFAARVKAGASH